MGFYITLCTVHTGQGPEYVIIVFYCANPIPCPCPGPGPVQCVWAIRGDSLEAKESVEHVTKFGSEESGLISPFFETQA